MKLNLYQYAVIQHGSKTKEGKEAENSKIIMEPATMLAKDEKTAALLIARKLPEDCLDKLDLVDILIRPF